MDATQARGLVLDLLKAELRQELDRRSARIVSRSWPRSKTGGISTG
jgi:hypothetical protein